MRILITGVTGFVGSEGQGTEGSVQQGQGGESLVTPRRNELGGPSGEELGREFLGKSAVRGVQIMLG